MKWFSTKQRQTSNIWLIHKFKYLFKGIVIKLLAIVKVPSLWIETVLAMKLAARTK